jgi:iron(III) transport system substrate-binding protein
MRATRASRRDVLRAATAFAAGLMYGRPLVAAAPEPSEVTPALIAAARREGQVSFYSAIELAVTQQVAKAFEARYPGIRVRVERSGAERIFTRIGQEQASRIYAVDVACSTDAGHFVAWKREGWLASYVPLDAASHFPSGEVDADGMHATVCATLSTIGYNSNLVRPEEAPTSYADLLDPRWAGRIVKAHPGYSGAILTATFLLVRELGWPYLEKLARQKVMQVQSGGDPPKKLALGERAVQADGTDSIVLTLKEQGQPVEVVHAAEGSPLIITPAGIFRSAPNPNAARLLQNFLFGIEGQQIFADTARHSFHALVRPKAGRKPLSAIKLMRCDPVAVEAQAEEIKARYARIFRV